MNKILISYDSRDEDLAYELKHLIEEIFPNVDAFVAGRSLEGGQVWIEAIRRILQECDVILALITNYSLKSNWVYFEMGVGFVSEKTIPLLTDGLQFGDLKPPMSLLHARELNEAGFKLLISDLAKKINVRVPSATHGITSFLSKLAKHKISQLVGSLFNQIITDIRLPPNCHVWIYQERCVVIEMKLPSAAIAIDIYCDRNKLEFELFGRTDADTQYLVTKLLPKIAKLHYVNRGGRYVFNSYEKSVEVASIMPDLRKILSGLKISI